tara:strand:+ start:1090 stop:1341 length:252 start_codon:yes stop_codon:yes gene_type:complete
MFSFSAINPAYPNACVNETISGLPASTTSASFNSNTMAQKFGALLDTDCSSRGFTNKGAFLHPMVFHPTQDVTVNWNGQVWIK